MIKIDEIYINLCKSCLVCQCLPKSYLVPLLVCIPDVMVDNESTVYSS